MQTELADPVNYRLPLNGVTLDLLPLIGKSLKLLYTGNIFCVHCSRKIAKSFGQGYCYPCFSALARCDICIIKPEQCHYHAGTCREPEWALEHCFQPHIVYLTNASGIKVGITRQTQIPTRWIDQGALQALPVLKTASRFLAGLIEVAFAQHVSDKTSWQRMLKNSASLVDLAAKRDELLALCAGELNALRQRFGAAALEILHDIAETRIHYPVQRYPDKVRSASFDKQAEISGSLHGIKGQYLLFESGAINIRKFTGYEVEVFL